MRKLSKVIVAVATAGLVFCSSVAMVLTNNENTKVVEDITVGEDTKVQLSAKDLGIDASLYTQDSHTAEVVNSVADMDIDKFINTCVELIPMEDLNIVTDNSSEKEVMGGKDRYVDKGGLEQSAAVKLAETPMYVYGVDVSKWQGAINWNIVKAAGVSFAMIKCAGRSTGDGSLYIDPYFAQNIAGATAAGIQVGVYFFSQAVNVMEAYEEACLTVNLCEAYNITYPVAFDWESEGDYRVKYYPQNQLTMNMIAATFCNTVASYGYTPMVYACKSDLLNTYEAASLSASYKIWMANYFNEYYYTPYIYRFERALPATPFPYQMWQFGICTNFPGFSTNVDMDLGFFYYMGGNAPQAVGPTNNTVSSATSSMSIALTNEEIKTTYNNPVNLMSGVVAKNATGMDATSMVQYIIMDAYGNLVTEEYAFINVGVYAIKYMLTDTDGSSVSKNAMLYVYAPGEL